MPRSSLRSAAPVVLVALLAATGCTASRAATPSAAGGTTPPATPASRPASASPVPAPVVQPSPGAVALPALGARVRPDVLVTGPKALSPAEIASLTHLAPAQGTVSYSAGSLRLSGHDVRAVGVDPATFRRFAAQGTAEATAVWQSVARGEVVVSHDLATRLHLALGSTVRVGTRASATVVPLRLGALATTGVPGTDLLVDAATGARLGLTRTTAVLLSAGSTDPVTLASKVRAVTGGTAEVDLLTAPAASPVAFLSGSKAAKAFGAFSYRYFPDGTIQPDARWVDSNIVSGTVPIFGRVTCHRLMLPQLRGALEDVVKAGLASTLHTYDGCYVPRFIERNPEHAISLHTWGIAIDLDAATNYRGIRGTMDPRVVAIFKHWGFRWGGDFSYTDPMHFEIGALLTTPRS